MALVGRQPKGGKRSIFELKWQLFNHIIICECKKTRSLKNRIGQMSVHSKMKHDEESVSKLIS